MECAGVFAGKWLGERGGLTGVVLLINKVLWFLAGFVAGFVGFGLGIDIGPRGSVGLSGLRVLV